VVLGKYKAKETAWKKTGGVVRAPTLTMCRSGPEECCCGLFGHFYPYRPRFSCSPSASPLSSEHTALIDAGHFTSFIFFFIFSFSTMQSRRSGGLTPLAIVLPHPPLPHRRSSLLSLNSAASPRTPRSCADTSLYYPANRKSTDSWNSSNADDMDFEWKPEQVLLLSRVHLQIFFLRFPILIFLFYRLWTRFQPTLSLLSTVPFPPPTCSIKLLVASPKPKALQIGLIQYAQHV
jgi:hypothetical protein